MTTITTKTLLLLLKKRIFVLCILLMIPFYGRACDCTPQGFIDSSKARHIFTGKVESIKKITSPFLRYEVTFVVDKWIKGTKKGDKKMIVNVNCLLEMCCGFEFDFYSTYEVFTFTDNKLIYTGFCTGTHKVEEE